MSLPYLSRPSSSSLSQKGRANCPESAMICNKVMPVLGSNGINKAESLISIKASEVIDERQGSELMLVVGRESETKSA